MVEDHPIQNWNGSAKVALISIERSEAAWRAIAAATDDARAVGLADLLVHLRDAALGDSRRRCRSFVQDSTRSRAMASHSDDRPDTAAERIEKLRGEVAALAGGMDRTFVAEDVPPGVEEQFWKQVLAFEHAPLAKPYDLFARAGITIPAPEDLDDTHLADKLWEIIEGLAAVSIFLHLTDHLSDRELYVRLWKELLHDEVEMMAGDNSFTHVDFTGSGSRDDVQAYLKYYADDDVRERWAKDFPDLVVPERAPRPFDRDSRLPSGGGW